MTTPVDENREPQFTHPQRLHERLSNSDDEGTLSNDLERPERTNTGQFSYNEKSDDLYLRPQRTTTLEQNYLGGHSTQSDSREEEQRLEDDLAVLEAERKVSRSQSHHHMGELTRSHTVHHKRSRQEPVDEFDVNTNPIHERASGFRPPQHPEGTFAKTFKRIHESSFLVRYFMYIVPLVLIILIPLMLGGLLFKRATVGGVRLLWFCVWLEVVWLTLWGGRITAKALPWPVGLISSIFTNNSKKWRDMAKQLEIPATLFFWLLAVLISFLPVMTNNQLNRGRVTEPWMVTMNKVIISFFIGVTLNFGEKIIIQLIAISFHLRTYADRIEINKFQIGSLTKLYQYSKEKITMEDSDFEETTEGPGSGARTPMQYLNEAQKKTQSVFGKVGDVAGKVAGDFTGKQVTKSTHPRQLVLTLLNTPTSSQVLARRLYRTFVKDDADTISQEDLKHAFDNDEEAESAFSMFDKDLNGDISMAELEAVCVEIGKERKSITASLKDLDSVVAKLDGILLFFVLIATVLIFLSLISVSAAGVLTSAGSTVLALSWLFSTTAQEFLASCIFVLVKHPFDVGDRVTIYGNTGSTMKGDDYLVKEISLLYTEFKKMEGHIVQAPNSYLNTLFILNMRRSGGLAEAVPMTFKFGTTLEQIDELRSRLLDFVKAEKREYQANILTEIRDIVEAYSINVNVIFFYKSNWQNELLRLQRRNKFICAMMMAMQEVGIQGPRQRIPGSMQDNPFYYAHTEPRLAENSDGLDDNGNSNNNGPGPQSGSLARFPNNPSANQAPSILRTAPRQRGESISSMSRRVEFLNVNSSADMMDDVPERTSPRIPDIRLGSPSRARDARNRIIEEDDRERRREDSDSVRRSESRSGNTLSPFGRKRSNTVDSKTKRAPSLIHRNRFFSRSKARTTGDVEAEDLMEQGMADIPETGVLPGMNDRMDPRTGLISPQAVRPSTDSIYSNSRSHQSAGVGPSSLAPVSSRDGSMSLNQPATRTRTEDYELRDLPRYPGT